MCLKDIKKILILQIKITCILIKKLSLKSFLYSDNFFILFPLKNVTKRLITAKNIKSVLQQNIGFLFLVSQ